MPLVIYFFCRGYFSSTKNLNNFTNTIIISGIITSTFIFLELFLKINKIGLNIWESLKEFTLLYHPWVSGIIGYDWNYFRPHGIFLDIHTQAFIIVTAILIYFSSTANKQIFIKNYVLYFFLTALLLSTSTLYILVSFILIVGIYQILNKNKMKEFKNKIFGKIIMLFIILISCLLIISPILVNNYFVHKFGYGLRGGGVFEIIFEAVVQLFTMDIVSLLKSDFHHFLIGRGTSSSAVVGGEAHYLGELLSHLGIIGTVFYIFPYVLPLKNGLKAIKRYKKGLPGSPFFIFSACLPLLIFATLLHYSPVNHCTVFIMGICLFSGYIDWSFIRYSRFATSISINNNRQNKLIPKP